MSDIDILTDTWYRMAKATTDDRLRKVYFLRASECAPDLVGSYIIERVLEHIPTLLSHRNYALLEEHVEWLVGHQGWKETLHTIRRHSEERAWIAGKVRDAVFHVLGLGPLTGLDIDPLKTFVRLKGDTLEGVRERAIGTARRSLVRQVKQRNTFFIQVEGLKETTFKDMIPSIVEVRKEEVLDLPSKPTFREVFSTYHGFESFAELPQMLGYSQAERTVSEGRRKFKAIAKSYDTEIIWKGKGKILPLREGGTIWTNTSPEMHQLLLNILRITLDRNSDRAAMELGYSCDSRVLRYLHQMYHRGSLKRNVRSSVLQAMAEIGEPHGRGYNDDFWLEVAKNIDFQGRTEDE